MLPKWCQVKFDAKKEEKPLQTMLRLRRADANNWLIVFLVHPLSGYHHRLSQPDLQAEGSTHSCQGSTITFPLGGPIQMQKHTMHFFYKSNRTRGSFQLPHPPPNKFYFRPDPTWRKTGFGPKPAGPLVVERPGCRSELPQPKDSRFALRSWSWDSSAVSSDRTNGGARRSPGGVGRDVLGFANRRYA